MFILFFWIIFGAMVGWVVGLLKNVSGLRSMSAYVALGVVGGLIGGYGSSWLFQGDQQGYSNDLTSMMFAIVGSVIIVILLATTDRKHS
jgi:uncharacterized membrane protein YeaQ/YmgE (transglycosylase-associated protein family)